MEKSRKKTIRTEFRTAVFERDSYRCLVCGKYGKDRQGGNAHQKFHKHLNPSELADLDSHHIVDRHLMPNGGYVAENGISLCGVCHEKAEAYWIIEGAQQPTFMPEHLYDLIGSSFELAIEVSESFKDE